MRKVLMIVAPYYEAIAEQLVAGASAVLEAEGCATEILHVPGAFEIPAAIAMAHRTGAYDGYVALGCVIRGETTHYDYVCGESARGLQELALREHTAIGYGILTCENMEQAKARAATTQGDKGGEAARAVLRMMELRQKFGIA